MSGALGRAARLLLAAAALVGGASFAAGPAAAQVAPAIGMEPATPSVGDQVTIRGLSWPANSQVHVELCGNSARRSTADCDQAGSVLATADASGRLGVSMTLGTPPVPCPCVIRASSIDSLATVALPVAVNGLASGDPVVTGAAFPDVQRSVEVVSAELTGGDSWAQWVGAAPKRTLVLTVRNTGNVDVTDPNLVVAVGKGANPTGIVAPPRLGTLAPGEQKTVTTTVELGAFSFGSYGVKGEVLGFDPRATFKASSSSHPWLLIAGALVLAQLALLRVRNRVRARIWRHAEVDVEAPAEITAAAEPLALVAAATAAPREPVEVPATARSVEVPATVDLPTAVEVPAAVVDLRAAVDLPAVEVPAAAAEPTVEVAVVDAVPVAAVDPAAVEVGPAVEPEIEPAIEPETEEVAVVALSMGPQERDEMASVLASAVLDALRGAPSPNGHPGTQPTGAGPAGVEPDVEVVPATTVGVGGTGQNELGDLVRSLQRLASDVAETSRRRAEELEQAGIAVANGAVAARASIEGGSAAALESAMSRYDAARRALDSVRGDADALVEVAHEQAAHLIARAERDALDIVEEGRRRAAGLAADVPGGPPSAAPVVDVTEPEPTIDLSLVDSDAKLVP